MTFTLELQVDSVVYETFTIESIGQAKGAKQGHRTVLENAGT
jgi:hypothetical protein